MHAEFYHERAEDASGVEGSTFSAQAAEQIDLLAWALSYAYHGVPVFPITPSGKAPLGKLAPNGLKNATTDPAAIAGWWNAEPAANIGLATGASGGHAWIAFDIDGEEGFTSLEALEAEHGPLPLTLTSLTGGGGRHHLFLVEPGLARNTTSRIASKIDTKGTGGYIVAPPSLHPSGRRYRWMPGREPWNIGAAAAPAWLRFALERIVQLAAPPHAPHTPWCPPLRRCNTGVYASGALRKAADAMASSPEGQRNETLNREVYSLSRFVASGQLDARDLIARMADAATAAGLGPIEIGRTIKSALTKGLTRPWSADNV